MLKFAGKKDQREYSLTYGTQKAGALAGFFFFGDGEFHFDLEGLCETLPVFDKVGKAPELLPTKYVRTDEDGTTTTTIEYTLDKNNLLSKVVFKEAHGDDVHTETYTLKWK